MDFLQIMEITERVYQDMFVEILESFHAPDDCVVCRERLNGMRNFYIKLVKELYQYDA